MEIKPGSNIYNHEAFKKCCDKYKKLKNKIKSYKNYCTRQNGISIKSVSSQLDGCRIQNIIDEDRRTIWHSDRATPHNFVIDLFKINFRLEKIKFIGISNWLESSSNPKWVQIFVSNGLKEFESIGNFYLINKTGTQLLSIRGKKLKDIRYLKILINETYGADYVYINNLKFFHGDLSERLDKLNILISESIEELMDDMY